MVEKLTFNWEQLWQQLLDIPAVGKPIAHPSKHETSVALCCDKTAHFGVAFYFHHHEVHLCNDHAV
jgi:hypothetical protein